MIPARALSLLFLPALLGAADPASASRALELANEAAVATAASDHPTALAKLEEAAALRGDLPRVLVALAAAQVATEKPDDALATLEKLAALGFASPVERSENFAALKERKEFKDVVKKLAANNLPQGKGELAFALRDVTGLFEGIAWRATTGDFYFADVNGRAVWIRSAKEAKENKPRRFTPEGDALLGVFGLAVDEAHGALWAATSAVPAMRGYTADQEGSAALAEIDLATGETRRVIPLVRPAGAAQPHLLGDLALDADGNVYLTDSGAPIVWRLQKGGTALEVFVQSSDFGRLQGIAVASDRGALFVSDHLSGLFRIDLGSAAVTRVETPAGASLVGIDGLALAPDGALIGIQNALRPNRVVRMGLDERGETIAGLSVLESAHLQMAAPSLGCFGPGGDFHFIGNAGWSRFDGTEGAPTPPRTLPIFKTKIAPPPGKKKA